MSEVARNTFRFVIRGFSSPSREECFIGWDLPLETFFAQIYPIDAEGKRIEEIDGEDATLLWVGAKHSEIRTVDKLVRMIGLGYGTIIIPKHILRALYEIEID